MPAEDRDVQRQKRDQRCRQDTGVHREESSQRMMTILRASLCEVLQLWTNDRSGSHDFGRDLRRVVALLIPRQQIAGQSESQHDLHQDQAEPEINFSRSLVRPVDHDLHQVQCQQHRHGLSGEVMQSAHQPAVLHVVLDVVHALPSGRCAGAVGRPEKEAGDDLDREGEDQRAAPDVSPACPAGDILVQSFVHQFPEASAIVEPVDECVHSESIDGTTKEQSHKVAKMDSAAQPLQVPSCLGDLVVEN